MNKGRNLFFCFVFLSTLLLFCVFFSCAEESFHIIVSDEGISGHQNNPVTVVAPEAGNITLEIWDETTLYCVMNKNIPQGKSQLIWDGLGWNEEPLLQKNYTLSAVLLTESGLRYSASTSCHVIASQQAVIFALPSDPMVYLSNSSDWFLEVKLVYTDQMVTEFWNQETGKLVLTTSRQVKGGRVNQIYYNGLTAKHTLSEGHYRLRIYGKQHASCSKEFDLIIQEGTKPEASLEITGDIMPSRYDSDQKIWEKMMSPATVIDIGSTAHQRVYEAPDKESKVLGTLHGQSQSVSVLEIQEKWVRIGAWNHENGSPVEGWVPRKVLKVVKPQSEFGILVDKKTQTLTLYKNGEKKDTLLVSTGRMSRGELYQETAAGSFLTDLHMSDYSTNGLKYDYVIRYDGGNLLHQIPYSWNEKGKKDMNPGELYLGTKASHACIRVQEKPSENGINAFWLWTHLPYHTRIIVLDDPQERENYEKIITGNTPDITNGLESSWKVEPLSDDEEMIILTFGGDVVLGGREKYYDFPDGFPSYVKERGKKWPFSSLTSLFEEDDLTVINLECTIKDDSTGEDLKKAWRFRGLPSYVEILNSGGIDAVNIANNHTIDYGDEGYKSTLQALNEKIMYFGNSINVIKEIKGVKFGFGGCRETTYRSDPGIIERDIAELRQNGADYIIYQCHWGVEYSANHNVLQEAMARTCQRAGADLVIGHHPHVVQGIDWIDNMPVIYSIGNLMFGGTIKLTTYDAILVQLKYYPNRNLSKAELQIIPILTSTSADLKINDYRPTLAFGSDSLRILRQVQKDTGFLLTDKIRLYY